MAWKKGDRYLSFIITQVIDIEELKASLVELEHQGCDANYKSKNPFPWMSETIDLQKEKNFFETRVTEYQSSGSLSWN